MGVGLGAGVCGCFLSLLPFLFFAWVEKNSPDLCKLHTRIIVF